jgi:hypothetical protein
MPVDFDALAAKHDRLFDVLDACDAPDVNLFDQEQALLDDQPFLDDGDDGEIAFGADFRRLMELALDRDMLDLHALAVQFLGEAARHLLGHRSDADAPFDRALGHT